MGRQLAPFIWFKAQNLLSLSLSPSLSPSPSLSVMYYVLLFSQKSSIWIGPDIWFVCQWRPLVTVWKEVQPPWEILPLDGVKVSVLPEPLILHLEHLSNKLELKGREAQRGEQKHRYYTPLPSSLFCSIGNSSSFSGKSPRPEPSSVSRGLSWEPTVVPVDQMWGYSLQAQLSVYILFPFLSLSISLHTQQTWLTEGSEADAMFPWEKGSWITEPDIQTPHNNSFCLGKTRGETTSVELWATEQAIGFCVM